jgi:hypothetical protein
VTISIFKFHNETNINQLSYCSVLKEALAPSSYRDDTVTSYVSHPLCKRRITYS